MKIYVSKSVEKKLLEKHNVTIKEVTECLVNQDRRALKDSREKHDTNPPTLWIIAETNHLRDLKVIFMVKDGSVIVKSAFEPNQNEVRVYNKFAQLLD